MSGHGKDCCARKTFKLHSLYMKQKIKAYFPANTRRGKVLKSLAVKLKLTKGFPYSIIYQQWMDYAEPNIFVDPLKNFVNPFEDDKPLFSIVVPTYNTQERYLQPLFYSICNQSFDSWELVIADGSTDDHIADAIKRESSQDQRIKYHRLKENKGISGNTNEAIKRAVGTFVVFIDHDDTISFNALNEVASYILEHKNTDILYSDEDKLTDNGLWRHSPHFKPDWSPHQFLTCNYTSHLSVIKRELINQTTGLDTAYNGAQDYELILRLHSLSGKREVGHIAKILYHWRMAEGSTAGDFKLKSYAIDAGRGALEKYLVNLGLDATVSAIDDRPGFYRPLIKPPKKRKVLLIVNASNSLDSNETYMNKIKDMTDTKIFQSVYIIDKANFLKNSKKAIQKLDSDDVVVCINAYAIPKGTGWLEELVGALEMEDIYAVSPRIIGFDHRVWDSGIVIDANNEEIYLFRGQAHNDSTIFGHTEWIRDVDKLTDSFFAIRKNNFEINAYAKLNNARKHIKSNDPNAYCVVWSPVQAMCVANSNYTVPRFNPNIYVGHEGSISNKWMTR